MTNDFKKKADSNGSLFRLETRTRVSQIKFRFITIFNKVPLLIFPNRSN